MPETMQQQQQHQPTTTKSTRSIRLTKIMKLKIEGKNEEKKGNSECNSHTIEWCERARFPSQQTNKIQKLHENVLNEKLFSK